MAMTKESMAAKIQAAVDAVSTTPIEGGAGTVSAIARQQSYLLAFCQGIIEEITQNGHATGADSDGDSHALALE